MEDHSLMTHTKLPGTTKTIGLVSLGCAKNLVDSEGMAGRLRRAGYHFASETEAADLILINTCGFVDDAKRESIDTILDYCRLKGAGDVRALVVTGCLAERYGRELSGEIPEVDRFLPIADEACIVEIVDRLLSHSREPDGAGTVAAPARELLTPFYTAYLKISEGCSNRCSYCAIPLIRGPHRSRGIPELLAEAEMLAAKGVRELVLIGQDITRYGADRGGSEDLPGLVRGLAAMDGLVWIRLLYATPHRLSEALIAVMATEPRVVPYLDLPVQHISETVLHRMGRRGGAGAIREAIGRCREAVPDLVLRTSLIVGFPGETEAEFRELCAFVEEARFQHLGVFTYSREEGTPAAALSGHVPEAVKASRRDHIMALQRGISRKLNRQRVGRTLKVLVEGHSPETELLLAGRYYGQAPEVDGAVLINRGDAVVGKFYDVRVTDAHDYDLVGEIVAGREHAGGG